MSGLVMSHREKISCIWHFQTVVLKTVLLRVVVSIYVMKILTKEAKLLETRKYRNEKANFKFKLQHLHG